MYKHTCSHICVYIYVCQISGRKKLFKLQPKYNLFKGYTSSFTILFSLLLSPYASLPNYNHPYIILYITFYLIKLLSYSLHSEYVPMWIFAFIQIILLHATAVFVFIKFPCFLNDHIPSNTILHIKKLNCFFLYKYYCRFYFFCMKKAKINFPSVIVNPS